MPTLPSTTKSLAQRILSPGRKQLAAASTNAVNHLLPHPDFMGEILESHRQAQKHHFLLKKQVSEPPFLINDSRWKRWRLWVTHLFQMFLPSSYFTSPSAVTTPISLDEEKSAFEDAFAKLKKRRIVVVGVHGWFPNKWLQRVIGVPKGTSTRLCKNMQAAWDTARLQMQRTIEDDDAQIEREDIEFIPLEGEGLIGNRVQMHFDQLATQHRELLDSADEVHFLAHSQGSPVTVLLAQRLLHEGILSGKSIRILALAGIFQGPLPALRSNLYVQYVEADAARELFELNNPESEQSRNVRHAIEELLGEHGVRMVVVGSWFDQVVPIYSSCMLAVQHPSIYRMLYVDAEAFQDDFLTCLADCCMRLTNDAFGESREQRWLAHELLSHLTPYLAGSLLTHNAHSTLYDDPQIYTAALKWFSPSDEGLYEGPKVSPEILKFPLMQNASTAEDGTPLDHPSYIPWILRGLLSNGQALLPESTHLPLERLQSLYRTWQPTTPALKELRRRLAPLQSRL